MDFIKLKKLHQKNISDRYSLELKSKLNSNILIFQGNNINLLNEKIINIKNEHNLFFIKIQSNLFLKSIFYSKDLKYFENLFQNEILLVIFLENSNNNILTILDELKLYNIGGIFNKKFYTRSQLNHLQDKKRTDLLIFLQKKLISSFQYNSFSGLLKILILLNYYKTMQNN